MRTDARSSNRWESQKEDWKESWIALTISAISGSGISKRGLKETWPPLDCFGVQCARISKRGLKGLCQVCSETYTAADGGESQKEDWKSPYNIHYDAACKRVWLNLKKRIESLSGTRGILYSTRVSWNLKKRIERFCRQKAYTATVRFRGISKRGLKVSMCRNQLRPALVCSESQKEDWKILTSCGIRGWRPQRRISKRGLKAFYRRRRQSWLQTYRESQKEDWKKKAESRPTPRQTSTNESQKEDWKQHSYHCCSWRNNWSGISKRGLKVTPASV